MSRVRAFPSGSGEGSRTNWQIKAEEVSTAALMPGDLVHVEPDTIIACDLLLITGTAIMGEAMLTGESQPVLKVRQAGGCTGRDVSCHGANFLIYLGPLSGCHSRGRSRKCLQIRCRCV